MIVRDLQNILDSWAPRGTAWERDSVGLQVGSLDQRVNRILVTLDVTDQVLDEARKKKIDLIISHHPLLFHAMKSIDTEQRVGRLVSNLVRHRIALYSAHTNLDFARGGVSFALAEQLALTNVRFLQYDQQVQMKIVVFVPLTHVDTVMEAMAGAGAGVIGLYELCSFRTEGVGTFRATEGARPFVGTLHEVESVSEARLEMVAPKWLVDPVVAAMRDAHPYEEVAHDVYPLSNLSERYGSGAIGDLPEKMKLRDFLAHVQRRLRTRGIRFTGDLRKPVIRIAVCGGSGSSLLQAAIGQKADAFVTADATYHTFQDCDGRIALVDAGHFETERPIVGRLVSFLQSHPICRKERIGVHASSIDSNFVQYFPS